jgi:hypothetical protein
MNTTGDLVACLSLAAVAVLAVVALFVLAVIEQDWLLTWLLFVVAGLGVSGLAWEARHG